MIDQYTTSNAVWEPYPVFRAISIFITDNWFPVLTGIVTLVLLYKLVKRVK